MKKIVPTSIWKFPIFLKACFLLIFLTCSGISLFAQNQTAKSTPGGIWYYEYLPPDYNSNTNNYPIVFFLHGLGERGDTETDLSKVAANGPPKYVKAGYKFPFILISPQLKSNKTGWPNSYIDQVIEYCRTNLRVDQSRIYLTGLSLGGGGSWGYIQDPDLGKKIAAAVICCGHQNNTGKACSIVANGIPIWAFHGDADGTVSVNKTINMVKAINACVPPPNPLALVTIYPGVGHNCWDNAFVTSINTTKKLPDLTQYPSTVYDWLLQFKNGGVAVNAGADITLNQPLSSTTITATASTESGSITTYAWTKVSGPSATITNGGTPTVSLTNLNNPGIYVFRLTVTTDGGDSAYDDVTVTVVAPVNINPSANAGSDKSITLPTNSLTLTGSGTDTDGSIALYTWTKVSGPTATLSGQATNSLNLSLLLQGTYVFRLTVTDDKGATAYDDVTVVVNPAAVNQNPTANAGGNKTVNLPTNSINLVGSGTDPDGSIATYAWVKLSGPTVTITNAGLSTVSLTALVAGSYVFQLTVTDNQGAIGTAQATVTVIAANQSPSANAGSDITITLPTTSTNISGSGTDPDGSISTYAWTSVSGPAAPTLTNSNTITLSVSGLNVSGTYVFRLTVTDDQGSTGFDDVQVKVNPAPVNVPPTANAGSDQSITLPINTITLTGSGLDTDGTIASYSWTKVSGPTATLVNQNTSSLTANNLLAGTYVFRLKVTDNQTATATDDVTVNVNPAPPNLLPVADAGTDVVITLPVDNTILVGSGTDADGSITLYSWTKTSGPSTFTMTGQATSTLQLTGMGAGVYTFQLTVTDNNSATSSDEVKVTVNAANVPPSANAGMDITITLPTDNTVINGSGVDSDGTISGYQWTQVTALPSVATLANETTSTLSVLGLVQGTYTFRLTVTDNNSATGFDDVKVIVNGANQSPTANAGSNVTITLPTSTANLNGSATDPDGTIATYAWAQLTGTILTLTNSNSPTLSLSNISSAETYSFRLTVTDDGGASDFDDVLLFVNAAAINQPPTVSAGSNKIITLPVNSLNLTGTASDPDGSIASYQWTLQGGPTATLTNANTSTVSLSNLLEGTYTFRLTVADNGTPALTAYSQVTVTVQPALINQPPTADAGSDQQVLQPLDNTTLFGSGSDPDEVIALVYDWTFVSGPGGAPVLSNSDKPTVTISNLGAAIPGTYAFRLTVTDSKGSSDTDDVIVTVNSAALPPNQAPTADAGSDIVITLPTNIANLNGSGSDADGSISPATGYLWVKVSGPSVTLGATNKPILSLSNLVQGVYIFRLQVTDDKGDTGIDDVQVTVTPAATNQSPVVTTDPNKSVFLPVKTVSISGSASDADGSIKSYLWTKASGPAVAPGDMVNANTTNLTVNNLVVGTYNFRLTATDNLDATGSHTTKVTVFADTVNQPPIANAGSDKTLPGTTTTFMLTGSGTDADGTIASYTWTLVSGPSCTVSGANTATPTVSSVTEGAYTFGLVVKDNKGKSSVQDNILITILPPDPVFNLPPVANAGINQTVQLPDPNTATLDGTASTDLDGSIVTYQWIQISTSPSIATLSGENTPTLTVSDLVEGTYTFRLTVTDNNSETDFDDVSVTVYPEPPPNNVPPTVYAGEDVSISLPDNSVTLTATADSETGLIESYKWIQVSGTPITLLVDTSATLNLAGLTAGDYIFSVTVMDSDDNTASDDVNVTVETGPSNTFSPNNDGKYDTWDIGDATVLNGCEINIYNRQGLKVYNSQGYPEPWNGTFNGKPLPEGVYFYVIRCSSNKPKTGSVTIIR